MREIKFRARRVSDRSWVYGTYAKHIGHFVIFDDNTGEMWVIYPTTLGQYTGLKDKNGVEIYEGDIVESMREPDTEDWEVDCTEVIMSTSTGANIWGQRWLTDHTSIYHLSRLSVIGNIYENPELLEKPNA